MAALTSIAVTSRTPKTVTVTFNAAALDLTGTTLKQLEAVVRRLMTECSADMPTDSSATITGI